MKVETVKIGKNREIAAPTNKTSLKDDSPIVHAHINLSDVHGAVVGGHLAPGTTVFAPEYVIQAFDGPDFSCITQTLLSINEYKHLC